MEPMEKIRSQLPLSVPDWSLGQETKGHYRLDLRGAWTVAHAQDISVEKIISALGPPGQVLSLRLNTDGLTDWDSILVVLILGLQDASSTLGVSLDLGSVPNSIQSLLNLATAVPERVDAVREKPQGSWLTSVGDWGASMAKDADYLVQFIGQCAISCWGLVQGKARYRLIDLATQVQDCGPSALPIVTLISLLVGLILAFVGSVQLALFGAQLYIADLVSLGMTREMGALMTAIIMAGRSGAAFAAQIGTMNVNMEIPALRVMGFSEVDFLVLPRLLALVFVMPFLCLYADLMGILGGGVVAISFFDIPLSLFLHRTMESVTLTDFFIGLFKCGLFGVLIAIAGCMRGVQCGRSASSVGQAATSAVVTSIVFIVVADSLVTLICNRLNI